MYSITVKKPVAQEHWVNHKGHSVLPPQHELTEGKITPHPHSFTAAAGSLVAGHSWLLLFSAHSKFESHSTHTPVKMGQSNMPLASGHPLPSATATQLQQLVTSSHSHHLSQKLCLFTKPWQTRHLPRRRVQSRSRVIWAWQWKMKAQTEAGALKHVCGWCSHRPADGQVEEKECKEGQETRTGRTGG